jgi:hypothetical protein
MIWSSSLSAEWPPLVAASGGTEKLRSRNGSGLTYMGALDGSSPTANLAGVNIKGNEAFSFIFLQLNLFAGRYFVRK